jgi:protein-tyrosine-phosphatase
VTKVLFVCTANQARSAFAEAILRREVGERYDVWSAGTRATDDVTTDEQSAEVAKRMGVDLSSHVAQALRVRHVRDGIVLCMTNEHLRYSIGLLPSSFARSFTLVDFVARGQRVGALGDTPLAEWLSQLNEGRTSQDLWLDGGPHDIEDPVDRTAKGHQRVFEQIETLVRFTAQLLL